MDLNASIYQLPTKKSKAAITTNHEQVPLHATTPINTMSNILLVIAYLNSSFKLSKFKCTALESKFEETFTKNFLFF